MKDNEIATTEQRKGYLILAEFDLAKAMSEELGGLDVTFERIKMPTTGNTTFEVPGEEPGEMESVKEFEGVILYQHPLNAYYRGEYKGGHEPPDCASNDGETGGGVPGGACKKCPLNQFGSGRNDGKACQNRRRLFILREGEILPVVLSIPAGSLKAFKSYILQLLGKTKTSNSVVTRFSAVKAENKGSAPFTQAQFKFVRDLTPAEHALIAPLSERIKAQSGFVSYDVDAPEEPGNGPMVDPETGEVLNPLY